MKRKHGTTTAARKPFKAPRKAATGGKVVGYQSGRSLATQPKQELKAYDLSGQSLAFHTTPNPPLFQATMNDPVNGAELYQRVGRKIYMKSLHFRATIYNIATAVQDIARIIIYYDSQPNAAAPTYVQLMQDSNAAAVSNYLSEINLTNRERFKIIRDMQFPLPSVTNAGGAGVLTNGPAWQRTDAKNGISIDEFIPLNGLETVYNATNGGTIADITSGALGFCLVSAFTDASWNLLWASRLRYYD